MKQHPDIVAIGEAMIEFTRRNDVGDEDEIFYKFGFGGDTSNAIIAAARQGASAGYITSLGNDPFAKTLLNIWQSEDVDVSTINLNPNSPTGIYFIDPVPDGHKYTYFRKNSAASLMTENDLPLEYIANAQILHVSGISLATSQSARNAIFKAIQHAKENGTKVSIDTNLRLKLWSLDTAKTIIHKAMQDIDIALPSYDDATLLTGYDNPIDIIKFYEDLGANIVVLKMGSKGCRLLANQVQYEIASFPVKALDSTAAGDTFCGAFLAELLRANNPRMAAQYACTAAAICVTKYGAVNAIPTRKDVEKLLR